MWQLRNDGFNFNVGTGWKENARNINRSSEMDNCETGITTLCRHAFLEQFPRLRLLVVDLDAAQQCIAIIPAITHNTQLFTTSFQI